MNSKQTEELATNAVRKSILTTSLLTPYISENEKGPSWDGFVYIYNSEKQTKQDYFGRVPVQVKGTHCEDLSRERITYSVDRDDLVSYARDGGVIYFVTYLANKGSADRIYYETLTPQKLRELLAACPAGQQSKTITLKPFPESESEKTEIFRTFHAVYKQHPEQAAFSQGSFITGGIPFAPGANGRNLPSYWKYDGEILSEDRLMDSISQPGLHILDLNYGNQVSQICRRLKAERGLDVRSFTCEELVDKIVSCIRADEDSAMETLTEFFTGIAQILIFQDLDFLAGKSNTQAVILTLVRMLSRQSSVVLSVSQLSRRNPNLLKKADAYHYYELCR